MVKSEFSFFDVEDEESSGEVSVLGQVCLGVAPERFDTVDVAVAPGGRIGGVLDLEVPLVTDLDVAFEGSLLVTRFGDPGADRQQLTIHRSPLNTNDGGS